MSQPPLPPLSLLGRSTLGPDSCCKIKYLSSIAFHSNLVFWGINNPNALSFQQVVDFPGFHYRSHPPTVQGSLLVGYYPTPAFTLLLSYFKLAYEWPALDFLFSPLHAEVGGRHFLKSNYNMHTTKCVKCTNTNCPAQPFKKENIWYSHHLVWNVEHFQCSLSHASSLFSITHPPQREPLFFVSYHLIGTQLESGWILF